MDLGADDQFQPARTVGADPAIGQRGVRQRRRGSTPAPRRAWHRAARASSSGSGSVTWWKLGPSPIGGTEYACAVEIAAAGMGWKKGYDYYQAASAAA